MQLTKNFHLNEFESKDGAETPCEVQVNLKELALNLQVLRDDLKKPIVINSGYRSPEHNKRVGGAKSSQHLLGKAADIRVPSMQASKVHARIEELIKEGKMKNGGLGRYQNFTHYDCRDTPARW